MVLELVAAKKSVRHEQFPLSYSNIYCVGKSISDKTFLLFFIIYGLFTPLLLILILFLLIWKKMQKKSQLNLASRFQIGYTHAAPTDQFNSRISTRSDFGDTHTMTQNQKKRNAKLAKIAIYIMAVFLVSWTPFTFNAIHAYVDSNACKVDWMIRTTDLSAKSSVLLNPIVYGVLNRNFKIFLRKSLGIN